MEYPKPEDSAEHLANSVPALMPKGSILFFEGQCYHAGGANTTLDQKRVAVTYVSLSTWLSLFIVQGMFAAISGRCVSPGWTTARDIYALRKTSVSPS